MQRYFSKEQKDNKFILNNDDLYHIRVVMRMKDNDQIQVVYNHEPYLCEIKLREENIDVNIIEKMDVISDNLPQVTLILPLLKEQKFDFILQKATELGITKIIPVIMERSIIKIDEKKTIKKLERWQKIVKEASEQSFRNDIPIITEIKQLKDLETIDGLKILCSTKVKDKTLKKALNSQGICDKISIVIGPEGGITEKEEEKLNNMGFISVTLGNRIMRVETVPIFIMSILNYECME